ncbi:MAG: TRAP transporter large permease subunit [Alphaproteobacteria bacterium]|nr:TRAP transporter large permease subunit [Alphaproteobacteria bacterium]
MSANEILVIVMFFGVCAMLMGGFPVAFSLAGVALMFAGFGSLIGAFDISYLGFFPNRIFGIMTNEVLIAVPLFVFMGVMLERSKVAEELLDTLGMAFGSLPGGLGISVCVVGALLAASTGIVGATVVTMGLLSLPTMLRRGYDPSLACGTICASGTLGQIIPPSIVLVVLGDQISNAYQEAQRVLGNYAPDPVSVGDLFAGALIPGLCLVGMYILYQVATAILRPGSAPPIPREELTQGLSSREIAWKISEALVAPVVLIVSVLGSILAGIATPTEAAAMGAIGATLLGGLRMGTGSGRPVYAATIALVVLLVLAAFFDLRQGRDEVSSSDTVGMIIGAISCLFLAWGIVVSLWRVYHGGALHEVVQGTTKISAMVFAIVIGAQLFSLVFRGFGGDDLVHGFLISLPGGVFGAMVVVMAIMFVMGFFLDFIEITFVVVPIVAPILLQMDINPVWLGIMIAVNLQTSFLTPPFGFALFYLRGVAPASVTTLQIYKGVVPFVAIQVLSLVLLSIFPGLVTWLPKVIYG